MRPVRLTLVAAVIGTAVAALAWSIHADVTTAATAAALRPAPTTPAPLARASQDARGARQQLHASRTDQGQQQAASGFLHLVDVSSGRDMAQFDLELVGDNGELHTVRTDAQGQVAIDPGGWQLEPVTAGRLCEPRDVVVAAGANLHVWVYDRIDVTVTVLGEGGARVAAAQVAWSANHGVVDDRSGGWQACVPRQGHTDRLGRLTLPDVAGARLGRIVVSHPDYLPQQRILDDLATTTHGIEIRLQPTVDAANHVTVVDAHGAAVAGACLQVDTERKETVGSMPIRTRPSDGNGRLALHGWMRDATDITIAGAAYPCRLPSGYAVDSSAMLRVARCTEAVLAIDGARAGQRLWVSVSAGMTPLLPGGAELLPQRHQLQVDTSGRVAVAVPALAAVDVEVHDDRGHLGRARVCAPDDGCELGLRLAPPTFGRLQLLVTGAAVTQLRMRGASVAGSLPITEFAQREGAITLTYGDDLRAVEVLTDDGRSALIQRHPGSDTETTLRLDFPAVRTTSLELVDDAGRPTPELTAILRPISFGATYQDRGHERRWSPGRTWSWRINHDYEFPTGGDGVTRVTVPLGRYAVLLRPRAWMPTLHVYEPALRNLVVDAHTDAQRIVVPRRSRLAIRLTGTPPVHWALQSPQRPGGRAAFEGDFGQLWITPDIRELQVVDLESRAVVAAVDVATANDGELLVFCPGS